MASGSYRSIVSGKPYALIGLLDEGNCAKFGLRITVTPSEGAAEGIAMFFTP